MVVKKVAVIGGGVSGLVSIKTCLEEGFEPVCFEQTDQYGGIWVLRDEKPSGPCPAAGIYDSLLTNSSKDMMCFSDFPFEGSLPPYLRRKDLLEYYRAYTLQFDLERYIRLNTFVKAVEQTDDFERTGQWRVTTQTEGRCEEEEIFDAVFVCTGRHTEVSIPDVPGMSDFRGKIKHSGDFKNGREYVDKTVVVVGGSHSAGDVAVDISRHAKQTYLSTKTGAWVLPREGPGGTPIDAFVNRRLAGLLPRPVFRNLIRLHVRERMNMNQLGLQSERPLFQTTSLMVNDEIGIRIWCGSLKSKPKISKFTETGVVFDDGTEVDDVDAVVFATGFEAKFPYLDASILRHNHPDPELYWHVFPPRLARHTMAVIGIVASVGAQGPVYEMQARLAGRVFKGAVELPGQDEMLADVARRKGMYFKNFGNHKVFFPPIPYMDMIAMKIGCRPAFKDLLKTDPSLAYKFIFGPNYPMFYRLVGAHAWHGARDAIFRAPADTAKATKTRSVTSPTPDIPDTRIFGKLMMAVVLIVLLIGILA
ncbi:flavin-containing monooxygenase 5-like [Diadema setosum]|uniref:flavin-containing monooxygenase 5-like n=1 Tax=Diadema setosum TaxID=31175 RepID=UPI003B3BD272